MWMMQRRRCLQAAALAGVGLLTSRAWAHHGWSSFDQTRPIFLAGRAAEVKWRNPHAELVLELASPLQLPADLQQRAVPAQSANVDGQALLAKATLPTRRDRRWEIELAPMFRLNQWKVPELKVGDPITVVGFTFTEEKGDPVLRAEYLFLDGQIYGMRSSPSS